MSSPSCCLSHNSTKCASKDRTHVSRSFPELFLAVRVVAYHNKFHMSRRTRGSRPAKSHARRRHVEYSMWQNNVFVPKSTPRLAACHITSQSAHQKTAVRFLVRFPELSLALHVVAYHNKTCRIAQKVARRLQYVAGSSLES